LAILLSAFLRLTTLLSVFFRLTIFLSVVFILLFSCLSFFAWPF
jgi:hypothetical protein